MTILGLISLIQMLVLPGVILLKLLKFKGSTIQTVVYTGALSLLSNYVIIFILTGLRIYNQPVMFLVFALEIFILWRLWDDSKQSLVESAILAWNKMLNLPAQLLPTLELSPRNIAALMHSIIMAVAIILSLDSLWWTARVFYYNLGSVFNEWDAVVSWNRWALEWANNRIALDSRLYPQLIPANWSLSYVFIGDTDIQFFAKAIMPLFATGILLLIFDLGIQTKQIGFFIGVPLTRLILKKFLGSEITNGYVDVAVAFFAFLPVYSLYLARLTSDEKQRRLLLVLGTFFAAGAGVTKQAGMYLFIVYPLLTYLTVLRPFYRPIPGEIWQLAIRTGLLAATIPLSWYVFKFVRIYQGLDIAETSGLIQIAANAHDNVGILPQAISSFSQFEKYIALFALLIIAFAFLDPLSRWLVLLVVFPYPILWTQLASYDMRNLAIHFPILGVTSALAIQHILEIFARLFAHAKPEKWRNSLFPVILGVIILLANIVFPGNVLRERNEEIRKQIFSPSLNQEIYTIIAQNPDALFLTNYPIQYLPNLENKQISFWYDDDELFFSLIQNPQITHLLVPSSANANINNYLNEKVKSGELLFLFEDTHWIPYRMYQIVR